MTFFLHHPALLHDNILFPLSYIGNVEVLSKLTVIIVCKFVHDSMNTDSCEITVTFYCQ